MIDVSDLPAGEFSVWLDGAQRSIRGEHGSDVPCDGCTACCTASQFIHIGPEEADTLAHVPAELLFPAPRLPRGHVVLPYNERGHCPMLIDHVCSIYEHRPRTCRTYDCRIFPAAGLEPEDDDKVLIADRARRWRFSYPSDDDRARHDAVRSAASFLCAHPELTDGSAAASNTRLAVAAVEVHATFVRRDPTVTEVRVELSRRGRHE
jgi:uncharacterized protein